MSETDVALYGGALWLGPLFLVGYLLVGWLMNAPLTKWGARRIERRLAREKRWQERSDELLRSSREHIATQAGSRLKAVAPPSEEAIHDVVSSSADSTRSDSNGERHPATATTPPKNPPALASPKAV